jgi:hypothetical protein
MPQMRCPCPIMEFEIVAEHREQMFFKPHHQWMHPAIENDIRALETHLGREARREVLDMDRRRNDRAGNREALGDVAFHLRAEHQFGLRVLNGLLHREMIVGNQWFDAVKLGGGADVAGIFAVVAAETDDLEAEFLMCDARCGNGMGRIAKDENALGGQVIGVDRAAPP